MMKCGRILSITNRQGTPITSDTNIGLLNPFRYRGYVYDDETGLYYLQSRYYDPVTGRFINADIYCDTQSGSPLSTNMFAYCENNCLLSSDPTGYWDYRIHFSVTKSSGFSSMVQNWVQYPDLYFQSDIDTNYESVIGSPEKIYCSSPFHSRDSALSIAAYIFNKAISVKKLKKPVTFFYSKEKKDKNKVNCLYIDYFGYRKTKTDNKLTYLNSRAVKLKNMLNSLKTSKNQADALMGLCLHTLQDYFAHKIRINVRWYAKGNNRGTRMEMSNITTTDFSNKILHNTKVFEDNINVIPWRYKKTVDVTKILCNRYNNNQTVSGFTYMSRGEYECKYYVFSYNGITYYYDATEANLYFFY